MGTPADSGATVQARLAKRYPITTGPNPFLLVDDFATEGYALRFGANSFGTQSLIRFNLPSYLNVQTNSSVPRLIFGARFHIPSTARSYALVEFFPTTGSPLRIFVTNSVTLAIENPTTTLQTATSVLTPGAWHHIEWEFKATDSAGGGYMLCRLDGTQIMSQSATIFSVTTLVLDYFRVRNLFTITGTGNDWIGLDDVYILDRETSPHTATLGQCRVIPSIPDGDDTPLDWVPDTGSTNYTQVADLATTSYVSSDTDGDQDTYDLDDVSVPGQMFAVKTEIEAINSTSGTPKVNFGLAEGIDEDLSVSTIDNTSATKIVAKVHNAHPDGSPWSESSFNSVKAIIRFEA
jgi:hypothetical protein